MNREQFEQLLSGALDNDLSASEFAEFEQHLASSPEARALYLDAVDLHNLLELELQAKIPRPRGLSNVVDVKRILLNQRRKSMQIATVAAAAVLLMSLLSLQFFMTVERPPTLSFDTASGTEFTLTHRKDQGPDESMTMENGSRLRLSKGTVELQFASGVRSIITAPADITLRKHDTLSVNRGTAWFDVPESAVGFTVETKELTIVDLGTKFGVLSKANRHDEVHVFKGKVRVDARGLRRESVVLVANEARRSDPIGRLHAIPIRSSAFLSSLPQYPPYLHWSFDEEDGFDAKGNHLAASEMVILPSPVGSPPQIVKGKFGSALSLDGNQQSLVTDWSGIHGVDQPLSVAMWVRIPSGLDLTNYSGILGWGIAGNSNIKWKVFVRSDRADQAATVFITTGAEQGMHRYQGETRMDDDQWHHIAVVNQGIHAGTGEPDVTLYVNGERESLRHHFIPLDAEKSIDPEQVERHRDFKPFAIGKGPVPQDVTFRGLIDELYLFEGILSPNDIKELMNSNRKNQ